MAVIASGGSLIQTTAGCFQQRMDRAQRLAGPGLYGAAQQGPQLGAIHQARLGAGPAGSFTAAGCFKALIGQGTRENAPRKCDRLRFDRGHPVRLRPPSRGVGPRGGLCMGLQISRQASPKRRKPADRRGWLAHLTSSRKVSCLVRPSKVRQASK